MEFLSELFEIETTVYFWESFLLENVQEKGGRSNVILGFLTLENGIFIGEKSK